jgi:hypothetical protein
MQILRAMEAAGIEPASSISDSYNSQRLTSTPEKPLAYSLARQVEKSPDLALVVEHWDSLPDAVRAGIVAMVKAAAPRRETPDSKEAR